MEFLSKVEQGYCITNRARLLFCGRLVVEQEDVMFASCRSREDQQRAFFKLADVDDDGKIRCGTADFICSCWVYIQSSL